MASLTPVYLWRSGGNLGLRAVLLKVSDATAADTVTVAELQAVVDTQAFLMTDGSVQACTEATNVVTIGAGPADEDVLILVSGH